MTTKLLRLFQLALLVMAFLSPSVTYAKALCPMLNAPSIQACVDDKVAQVVDELSSNITQIHQLYKNAPDKLTSFDRAQQTWDAYRKLQCLSVYQHWQGDEIADLMTASCAIELGRQRNQFLRQHYLQ